jgi:hypothetical protein
VRQGEPVRDPVAQPTPSATNNEIYEEDDMCCPICMEVKSTTQLIPHWQPKGDISSHKMCAECTANYNKNECPFCHEVSIKEEILEMIRDFIRAVGSSRGDPNTAAALVERWQWFEMEFSTNISVVHRVCKLVLQGEVLGAKDRGYNVARRSYHVRPLISQHFDCTDLQFSALLKDGVQNRSNWIRDAGGLIFRWRSLSNDGKLDIEDDTKDDLEKAYKVSISKLKEIGACGHHMGAFYSQALAVWLAASQGNDDGELLRTMVKQIGGVVISIYKKNKASNKNLKKEVRRC